jgi:peroxiredoxin
MKRKNLKACIPWIVAAIFFWPGSFPVHGETPNTVFELGTLKPIDSQTTLKVGSEAPDFTLPALDGSKISLRQYRGKKNVVLSFVPAAWTSVCTYQWPVYDLAEDIFRDNDAVLLGITVDNIPTLYAWTKTIASNNEKFWFPVLSDFYPHGAVAQKYGVLRSEGFSERALFVVDKQGIIRFMVIHDINERPPLLELQKALKALKNGP